MSFSKRLGHSPALESLSQEIAKAQRLVVLTGAGVSKESGIPTFRDAQTGLWAKYDPQRLASREGFLADPACVWGWYDFRRNKVWCVQPNAGHQAIQHLEAICQQVTPKRSFTLITQNIDNLHQKAGSQQVLELHGNIFEYKCLDCEQPFLLSQLEGDEHVTQSKDFEALAELPLPPQCQLCGGWIRPNVVWFGEMLNDGILSAAYDASRQADVMIVAGTSGVVYPAADLPAQAKRSGAVLIEVNPEPSALSPLMDVSLKGTSAELLPDLVNWMGSLMKGDGSL